MARYNASGQVSLFRTHLRQDDLYLNLKHGFLSLHDPALDPPIAAPGPLASDAGGVVYEEWRHARLVLLPKKGDLSLYKKWRGICLLDVCLKLLSSILACRLQTVMEEFGMDAQTGYRPDRGTIDGLLLRLSDFTNARNMDSKRGPCLLTW